MNARQNKSAAVPAPGSSRSRGNSRGRVLIRGTLPVLAGLAIALPLILSGLAAALDRPFHDMEARLQVRRADAVPPRGRVGLVYVDQASLDWAESALGLSWPWPRETYGIIADFCGRADALAFDILFTEASPYGAADDQRFLAALRAHGRALLAGNDRTGSIYAGSGIPFGSVRAGPDPDGVLRRYLARDSLGLAAARIAGIAPTTGSDAESARRVLRYRGPSPSFTAWSAASILAAALAEGQGGTVPVPTPPAYPAGLSAPSRDGFSGMILFVGLSAPGLMDRIPSPVDPSMPGAEVHATFADNLITGDFLREPGLAAVILGCLATAAAAAAALLARAHPLRQAAGIAASVAIAPAAAMALYPAGILLPVAAPVAAALASALSGLALAYEAEGRQRAWLRKAFGQYLSHDVIDRLLREPGDLRLGGERRPISVLFTDVQGFTALSERLDPERLTAFMNRYLGIVTAVILDSGGTIDKYIGDAVVAFWNAPLDQADHARRALAAASGIRQALSAARGELEALAGSAPATRIGVHSGDAVVGNMGSPFRFAYTALGDAVNLASRLEGANKALGTFLLVSGDTIAAASPATADGFRRLGLLKVSGRDAPCEVWSPDHCEPWEGLRALDTK